MIKQKVSKLYSQCNELHFSDIASNLLGKWLQWRFTSTANHCKFVKNCKNGSSKLRLFLERLSYILLTDDTLFSNAMTVTHFKWDFAVPVPFLSVKRSSARDQDDTELILTGSGWLCRFGPRWLQHQNWALNNTCTPSSSTPPWTSVTQTH